MAEELHHPHDALVRTVLSDVTAATSFLQAHLAPAVSQRVDWATLRLVEGSFVDEAFRTSEADLLYEVAQCTGDASLWPYVLVEHQSTPDRWMRLRLLKYCCRIWERQLTKKRREAPAFMPGMDRRWARRAQCPRAQQDPRSA